MGGRGVRTRERGVGGMLSRCNFVLVFFFLLFLVPWSVITIPRTASRLT